jgi:MFS family permease
MRLIPIFLANIFLSFSYATVLYVNSTFLGQYFDPLVVSAIFLASAVGNILFFLLIPRLVEWFYMRTLLLLFLIVSVASLVGVVVFANPYIIASLFILYASIQFMSYYCLDIFLEDHSTDQKTGGIRGLYLTLGSAAIASAPLLLTIFDSGEELRPIYIAATSLLVPPIFLVLLFFKNHASVPAHLLDKASRSLPFGIWWRDDSIRRATLARLVLEFFYTFMVIYTPLYLHGVLGFDWAELGIIFTVMLLPFVLFEWPMGELADRLWGEKEIMSLGFFITGVALLIMPFLGKLFLAWMVVLFVSRVGASFVEVATESHFFKHVDSRDIALISIFRLARPAGVITGTVAGAISIQLFSFEKIFFVLAVVVFLGLKESVFLKDSK